MLNKLKIFSNIPTCILSRILLCATFSFVLSNCSHEPKPENIWGVSEQKILQESFQHLNDYYVQDFDLSNLALAGINSVLKSDPDLQVTFDDQNLTLTANSDHIHTVKFKDPDLKFPASWAKASRRIISEAQHNSSTLQDENMQQQLTTYIRALMGSLDRYSRYSDPLEALSIQQSRDGFGGVGIDITKNDDQIEITHVEIGSPSDESHIHEGDVLLEIDDILLEGLGVNEIQTLLRGPVNRRVKLLVSRESESAHDVFVHFLVRTRTTPNTVHYKANLLYPLIKIDSFNKRTSKRLAEAIARAKAHAGLQLKGIILDIRGNPGGLLQEAIDSADLLMDHGTISQTQGRNPLSFQKFNAEPGNVLGDTPMVVLIDGATASAAEILAAALQDHHRAVIVGSISYGKGTVQNLLPLSNHGEMALTWAYYLAPLNYHLQGYGILPNICTSKQENGIAAVLKTLRAEPDQSRQNFQKMRKVQYSISQSFKSDVQTFRNNCLWQGTSDTHQDIEIEAAKALLSNPSLYVDALNIAFLNSGS